MQWTGFQEKKPELREPKCFLVVGKEGTIIFIIVDNKQPTEGATVSIIQDYSL